MEKRINFLRSSITFHHLQSCMHQFPVYGHSYNTEPTGSKGYLGKGILPAPDTFVCIFSILGIHNEGHIIFPRESGMGSKNDARSNPLPHRSSAEKAEKNRIKNADRIKHYHDGAHEGWSFYYLFKPSASFRWKILLSLLTCLLRKNPLSFRYLTRTNHD